MRIGRVLVLCGLIVAVLPAPARADGYFAPFVGANFGGALGRPLDTRFAIAIAIAWPWAPRWA